MDREWTMENSFHRIVSQTMRLYFARNYQVMERLDVHPGQVPVLFEIHRKGGLYQKELCDSLCLRASTVTVMLQRMTKNGLVERRQDEADQRRTRIFLTEKGEAAIRDLRDATQKVEEECFEGFSMEEILLLKRFAMQVFEVVCRVYPDYRRPAGGTGGMRPDPAPVYFQYRQRGHSAGRRGKRGPHRHPGQ